MIKTLTAIGFLLMTTLNSSFVSAAGTQREGNIDRQMIDLSLTNLPDKSPEFLKYYNLGLEYLRFMDSVSSLDEASLKSRIHQLFADQFPKISNEADLLARGISNKEALFQQFMEARKTFGKWKFRKESFRIIPAPELSTTTVHFIFDTADGRSFNTIAILGFDSEGKILHIIETFAPVSLAVPATD